MCVRSPGITGERETFRDGCFTPSAYHNGASRFPSIQHWYLCKPNPGHLSPSRTETKRAVFYQRLTEVYKINSQSPSGNLLFSHAEKIRHDFKGAPCSRLTAKGEGPSPSSGGWRGWGERGRRRHDREERVRGFFGDFAYVCVWGFYPSSRIRQYFSSNRCHAVKYPFELVTGA